MSTPKQRYEEILKRLEVLRAQCKATQALCRETVRRAEARQAVRS